MYYDFKKYTQRVNKTGFIYLYIFDITLLKKKWKIALLYVFVIYVFLQKEIKDDMLSSERMASWLYDGTQNTSQGARIKHDIPTERGWLWMITKPIPRK